MGARWREARAVGAGLCGLQQVHQGVAVERILAGLPRLGERVLQPAGADAGAAAVARIEAFNRRPVTLKQGHQPSEADLPWRPRSCTILTT